MTDPLAGKRTAIADGELKVLRWPADRPCPVDPGDRFPIRGGTIIEIERVTRKLIKGKPAEWHATFIRHERDRVYLLRRTPSGMPSGYGEQDGLTDIEKARREGNYTSSQQQALHREPESVGPDWHDPGVAERERTRQQARAEDEAMRREEAIRRALGRVTADLTIEQRLKVLAEIERTLAAAGKVAA